MTKQNKRTCPYCSNKGSYYLQFRSANYYRCSSCDLIYKEIKKSYFETVLKYRNYYYDNFAKTELMGKRDKLFIEILRLLEQKLKTGKILDVGTGCGFFLKFAQKRGWKAKGIDPSTKSVDIAKKNNLDVTLGTLKEFRSNEKFDIITFINALDHSAQPWKEVQLAQKLLKPDGFIFIRSPNGFLHSHILRLSSKIRLENCISNLLVFHEFSFTFNYIKRLLIDCGFSKVIIMNSPPSGGPNHKFFIQRIFARFVGNLIYFTSGMIRVLSLGHFFLGSSLWIIASQNQSPN